MSCGQLSKLPRIAIRCALGHRWRWLLPAFFFLSSVPQPAQGRDWLRLDSAGARFGLSFDERTQDFEQAEAFIFWNLPWGAQWDPEWHVQWRMDLSLGSLSGARDAVVIGTIGPSLVLRREALPLTFEVGLSPTFLSEDEVGSKSFGTIFQFTSHAGFNLDISTQWRLSYRFQHMSNAGINEDNPGLNLHVLGFGWRF
jgi:hypothetical protein